MQRSDKYIHMTTSATLALLKHSDFCLSSVHTLIHSHQIAPLSGEISCGGLTSAVLEKGTTAFARMGDSYWNSQRLNKYGQIKYAAFYHSAKEFLDDVTETCVNHLNGILPLVIHTLRDKQMRVFPTLSDEQKLEAIAKLRAAELTIKKIFITNYVVAKYFRSISKSYAHSDKDHLFIKKLATHLDENFLELTQELICEKNDRQSQAF